MANPDGYSTPVDFRVTQNPVPIQSVQDANYNFQEVYDFIKQVILTFVRYCGIGQYDTSVWPLLANDPGQLLFEGNVNKIYIKAQVNINANFYITLVNVGGILEANFADASSGSVKWADGFCTTNVLAGAVGEFILNRGVNIFPGGGLVVGQRYWLGATGNIRTTPATAAGQLEQYLGIAVSTMELVTNIMYPIQH